jgi:hypothetical protein
MKANMPTSTSSLDWMPDMVFSGGQTGVDRAALDWACHRNIPHGGWCPRGRLALDGPLPARYHLRETESEGYRQRTKLNVQDSDGTLIFNQGPLVGGTLQTVKFAKAMNRPYLVVQLESDNSQGVASAVVAWLKLQKVSTLNIAGPSEAKRPGVYALVLHVLDLCSTAALACR